MTYLCPTCKSNDSSLSPMGFMCYECGYMASHKDYMNILLKGGKKKMSDDGFEKIEPNVWKPINEGDEIMGTLIKSEKSANYDNKVYSLETEEDGQTVHKVVFGTTVLDDRMGYIKEGDEVKIVYKGTQKNKKGQDTKIYEVFKKKTDAVH
jgi:hypothetical protein